MRIETCVDSFTARLVNFAIAMDALCDIFHSWA